MSTLRPPTLTAEESVEARLTNVRQRILDACEAAGREPDSVHLVAVSKRHSVQSIEAAIDAGQTLFGENYVQELVDKAATVRTGATFRFIGHLQRNKVRAVVRTGAAIDTVDSRRLLDAISRISGEEGRVTRICLQVNVAGEGQKSGCAPEEVDALVRAASEAEAVQLHGLMTIPPAAPAESARVHFAALRRLAERYGIRELSMGMSADLEVAIAEGATMVRVGTAIFGPRPSAG